MKKIKSTKKEFLFKKRNYQFLLLSIIIIGVGFVLMVGGGSSDPNIFNPEIFNFRRIRLAPTLVLIGFAVAVYSILTSPKK
ncbi:MAG: hypothetical protein CMP52_01505 [Flavobacteriales bacterium]|jgi:hypothetical protein|nr:hypothetical protein [Candidatus Arcticimaribacter sp.]|tara:strand:+ start:2085 stop:2327 length:243 start_codon:yes stop_codon:yes gene_type:complete